MRGVNICVIVCCAFFAAPTTSTILFPWLNIERFGQIQNVTYMRDGEDSMNISCVDRLRVSLLRLSSSRGLIAYDSKWTHTVQRPRVNLPANADEYQVRVMRYGSSGSGQHFAMSDPFVVAPQNGDNSRDDHLMVALDSNLLLACWRGLPSTKLSCGALRVVNDTQSTFFQSYFQQGNEVDLGYTSVGFAIVAMTSTQVVICRENPVLAKLSCAVLGIYDLSVASTYDTTVFRGYTSQLNLAAVGDRLLVVCFRDALATLLCASIDTALCAVIELPSAVAGRFQAQVSLPMLSFLHNSGKVGSIVAFVFNRDDSLHMGSVHIGRFENGGTMRSNGSRAILEGNVSFHSAVKLSNEFAVVCGTTCDRHGKLLHRDSNATCSLHCMLLFHNASEPSGKLELLSPVEVASDVTGFDFALTALNNATAVICYESITKRHGKSSFNNSSSGRLSKAVLCSGLRTNVPDHSVLAEVALMEKQAKRLKNMTANILGTVERRLQVLYKNLAAGKILVPGSSVEIWPSQTQCRLVLALNTTSAVSCNIRDTGTGEAETKCFVMSMEYLLGADEPAKTITTTSQSTTSTRILQTSTRNSNQVADPSLLAADMKTFTDRRALSGAKAVFLSLMAIGISASIMAAVFGIAHTWFVCPRPSPARRVVGAARRSHGERYDHVEGYAHLNAIEISRPSSSNDGGTGSTPCE